MDRKWIVAGVVLALLGAIAFFVWFAPKGSTTLDEALADDAMALATGAWSGDDGHRSSGTVGLYETPDGPVLFFEDFEQTNGPDVFLYASSSPDGEWGNGERWKILIPGGRDGQTTVRGSFQVPIPAEVPVESIRSLITWCDRFGVPFGHAVLA